MKIKDGFVLEKVGDGYLAVAVGGRADSFSGLVRLNSTGAFLWNILAEGDVTKEELIDKMTSTYEVEREIAERDIDAFCEKLTSAGIIE